MIDVVMRDPQHGLRQQRRGGWSFSAAPGMDMLNIIHAEGAYLYTDSGQKILDAAGGAVAVGIGHGRGEVVDAIAQAVTNNSYVLPIFTSPEREALVEELHGHWLPSHLTRANFASSGSDAIEAAVKMALQYHAARGRSQKCQILSRSLSYHGSTMATSGWSGHAARKRGLQHVLSKNPMIETPYPLRCPLGPFHQQAEDYYIDNLRETITRVGADNIAALLAEPMSGVSGGGLVAPGNYWQRVQEILKENDILLILDEIITGFGRTGCKTGAERFGIKPDLLVSGKGLASGYAAINGVFGTDEIAATLNNEGFTPMYFTHSAQPMACAAATTVLQILRRESLLERAKNIGALLKQRLTDQFSDHPHVAEVRGDGLMIALEFVKDRSTLECFELEQRVTDRLVEHALSEGVMFYPGGTGEYRDILCIGAPFIIDEQEIEVMISAIERSMDAVLPKVSC